MAMSTPSTVPDTVMLPVTSMPVLLVASFVGAGFIWGSSWMSDTDYWASQVTAQ